MIFPSTLYSRIVIALNGNEGPEYFQAGDATMKPGMVVMEDDADEVKTCTITGKPIGIVGCDADHDLSTVYTLGERIPIWMLGCGVDIYVLCGDITPAQTITKGSIIDSSDQTTAFTGLGKVKDAYVEVTTAVLTAAGVERNLGTAFWIGRALATGSITTAVLRYVPVRLSV